jgi:autotransporter-associated beta strand protein
MYVKRWFLLLALLFSTTSVHAQTYTWIGLSSSTWDTNTILNWQGNGPLTTWTNGPTSVAQFNGSPTTNLVLGTNIIANSLQFNVDGYTINGGGFTLTLAGTNPGVNVSSGVTATIASPIAGTSGMIMSGTGRLVLSGANTYTGGTTISAGTLQIGNGGTTGSITGDMVNNSVLVFNRSDDLTFGGSISGTGSLTKAGAGLLWLSEVLNNYSGGPSSVAARSRPLS